MFGYVIPNKSELKVREFEVYNAWYCAVCHSLRDRYGQIPRLLLTYDSVFLAMILSTMNDKENSKTIFRCMTHPGKERYVASGTPEIDYAADMLVLLGYYNLKDDYEDEKSIVGLAGSTYLKRAFKKIKNKYPEKVKIIGEQLQNLTKIEKRNSDIFDEAAEPFSLLMEEVFDYDGMPEYDKYREAYRKIGFHLGKWIYLVDAFDDLKKDIEKKNYNPIIQQFKYGIDNYAGESLDDFKLRTNERIRLNLTLYLANIGECVERIPLNNNKEIIDNIVYLGLLTKTDDILKINSEGKIINESI